MQTINNRMTETQVADLFSLAVQLQVKAEESDDRDTAILAYSIQNACSNLTESRREFWAADATINNLELKITDMAVQLANAESKCRELAAENITLNDKMNRLATWPGIEFYSSSWEFCNLDGNDALEFMCDVKTPATDAFLAEVRAQGVERYAAQLKSEAELADEAGWDGAAKFLISESEKVLAFAAQIRQEAAK
ncbi:hypothetical protein G6S60_003485 [Salmonella enterica]|nr:hypothetical protein [Salmonella enterica]EDM6941257.1 hypothetical protein [Salmonella enterica subsp. enterica serovar Agona]EDT4221405.1 hypothetical protein [Salmonella enterica subsp. enterica serovar Hartford]EAO3197445.1 hypothetical protein [Salmonella enterica]EAT5646373.1 hypothetical protein [Salmonella enterica]